MLVESTGLQPGQTVRITRKNSPQFPIRQPSHVPNHHIYSLASARTLYHHREPPHRIPEYISPEQALVDEHMMQIEMENEGLHHLMGVEEEELDDGIMHDEQLMLHHQQHGFLSQHPHQIPNSHLIDYDEGIEGYEEEYLEYEDVNQLPPPQSHHYSR